jgi:NADPH2:quinone reductase
MARAIRFERFGGPEVLQYVDVAVPEPGAGQARVVHSAVGVNFIDVYHRTGLYPLTLLERYGGEAAGIVAATGGVTHVQAGDRAARRTRRSAPTRPSASTRAGSCACRRASRRTVPR